MITIDHVFYYKNYTTPLYFALALMLLSALPYLFLNGSRPLLSLNRESVFSQRRILNYFNNKPNLHTEYEKITNQIEHIKNGREISIALHIGGDCWDYPLWVMIKQKFGNSLPHISHLVKKDFEFLENSGEYPEYIIYENRFANNIATIEKPYRIEKSTENFSILRFINE